jgi:hypothetical protein
LRRTHQRIEKSFVGHLPELAAFPRQQKGSLSRTDAAPDESSRKQSLMPLISPALQGRAMDRLAPPSPVV